MPNRRMQQFKAAAEKQSPPKRMCGECKALAPVSEWKDNKCPQCGGQYQMGSIGGSWAIPGK